MSSRKRLNQLLSLAKKAHRPMAEEIKLQAPLGFSTRVAARWASGERSLTPGDLWERLCWCGASVAAVVCLAAAVHHGLNPEPTAFEVLLDMPQQEEAELF
jgi:hypothetical protein